MTSSNFSEPVFGTASCEHQSPQDAQADQELKKLDLELKKLQLETENLKPRAELEREKMANEIRELKEAPGRARRTVRLAFVSAFLSAFTALTVAAATGFITWQISRIGQQQHDVDAYSKLLTDLGSNNVPARAGAVVGLAKYAHPNQSAQADQTITVLVTQLSLEAEARVAEVLIRTLVELGDVAIDRLLVENRAAASKFIRTTRLVVLSKISPPTFDDANRNYEYLVSKASELYWDYDNGISKIILSACDPDLIRNPFNPENEGVNDFIFSSFARSNGPGSGGLFMDPTSGDQWFSNAFYVLAAGEDRAFGAMNEYTIYDTDWPTYLPRVTDDTINQIKIYARSLFQTSAALSRLLQKDFGADGFKAHDFEQIVLLGADLRGKNFDGAKMALSFILGVADSSSFQDADLSGANLAHLYLKDADLSYANLLGAYIPNPGSLRFKLRGANWWDSQTVSRGLTKAYCGSKGQFHSVQGDLCDFGLNPGSKKDVRADKATRSAYKMSTLVPANIVAEAEEQFEKEYPKSQNYQDRQKHEQLKRGTPLQSPFSTPTRE